MSTPVLLIILFVVVALVVIFWLTRTRGNTTGPHVDTTMTAVGVVTEAVEELADTVKHAVKGEPEKPEKKEAVPAPKLAAVAAPKVTASEPAKATAPKPVAAPAATKKAAPKPAAKAEKAAASKPAKAATSKPAASKPAKATEPKVAPAATVAAKPAKAPPAKNASPDDLRQLKGVGPKLVTLLNELGVKRFDQIAAWGPAEIDTIDAQLGTFKGRITRDNWVEQAGFLAKGDIAGFEAKFGKLDSPGNN